MLLKFAKGTGNGGKVCVSLDVLCLNGFAFEIATLIEKVPYIFCKLLKFLNGFLQLLIGVIG